MVDKKELTMAVQMDFYMAAVMVVMKEFLMVDLMDCEKAVRTVFLSVGKKVDWMAALSEFSLVGQMGFEMVG